MSNATINITVMTPGTSEERNVQTESGKTLQEALEAAQIDYNRLAGKGVYWTDQYGTRLNLGSVLDTDTRLMAVSNHSNGF